MNTPLTQRNLRYNKPTTQPEQTIAPIRVLVITCRVSGHRRVLPSSRLRAGPCNVAINSFINCDDDDDASDDDDRERRKRRPGSKSERRLYWQLVRCQWEGEICSSWTNSKTILKVDVFLELWLTRCLTCHWGGPRFVDPVVNKNSGILHLRNSLRVKILNPLFELFNSNSNIVQECSTPLWLSRYCGHLNTVCNHPLQA